MTNSQALCNYNSFPLCLCPHQALLKMDCQGLVARLVLDFVLLTTAVEVAFRWRELAEKLARVSRQQMEAYEAPHRDKNGLLDNEVRDIVSICPQVPKQGKCLFMNHQ